MRRALGALVVASSVLVPASSSGQTARVGLDITAVSLPQGGSKVDGIPPVNLEETCKEDCFLLSQMSVRGSVSGTLTFEIHGTVRAKQEQKIPLFGPPGQVRLENVSMDGGRPAITFDTDRYYLLTSAKTFTLRGRMTLGADAMLSIAGPVMSFDASLSKGRLVEGDKLSGLTNTVLHFDPLSTEEAAAQPEKKAPPVFRLSRAVRFGTDTTFVYRLASSAGNDLGTIRLPLAYGENVKDVQGSKDWTVEGTTLLLPTQGKDADITISGTMPNKQGVRTFKVDERSAYEWWLVEHDPEHRVATGGDPKLVEVSQSPIQPTSPSPAVFLVQRGQELEVDARSLVRGDVLAAVARTHKRFVAITGSGELISDELVMFDNHGLDHLMVTPAGKAMYLSTDGHAERILHTEEGARDVLVPVPVGSHSLRVQSLSQVRVWPLAGAIAVPSSAYPLATSASEVVVGLPENVHPVAVLGGDRARWALSRADVVAAAIGVLLACFGFRTRRTRALGALVTAGLWFVSHEAFVVVAGGLFVAGAVFLASRFLRGTKLLLASAFALVVALFTGRGVLADGPSLEPKQDLAVDHPELPQPEKDFSVGRGPVASVTPVSLSFPSSDRYVQSSRQLVTRERPFTPRVVYVTSTTVAALHVLWAALLVVLAWMHKDRLLALKDAIVARLVRRPDPAPAAAAVASVTAALDEAAPPF